MNRSLLAVAVGGVILGAVACSSIAADQRIGIITPDETQFDPVAGVVTMGNPADFLEHRCGSLDCHGQNGRNLRIWGCEGMRLGDAAPGCGLIGGQGPTTPDEYDSTFRSLVGLEPAVMTNVVTHHGDPSAPVEDLTFIRKALGTEAHKGGQLMKQGDSQYQCLKSWLTGPTDQMACSMAIQIPTFPIPDASTE
ncbi:MAG TPA: hypothetical protein VKU41_22815 [Polyangiaceae bacterium]|nr:hypothetical protein [Polyangiaceae bacterium]